MALDKGLADLLGRLSHARFPEPYEAEDEARDFAAVFLADDPTGARLRVLARILHLGGYFATRDVSGLPHSAEMLGHLEGKRVLAGEIVNALTRALNPPPPQPDDGTDDRFRDG